MIAKQALTEEIHDAAVRHGMVVLKVYATGLLLDGVTSLGR